MRIHVLRREQFVPRPLERVFPFFERPENLALITPPHLAFQLLTPTPVAMRQGRIIDYTIRLLGVPVRWRSLISTYDPPYHFVDEQLTGPYSYWHHRHRFEARGHGTQLLDEVHYALPSYLLPSLEGVLHSLYVGRVLNEIFDYRRNFFARFFCSTDTTDNDVGTM